MNKKIKRTAFI